MTVEQLLAEAVQNGLRGLTLWPTQDGRWQASTSPDRISWSVKIADDPVSALLAVLKAPTKSTGSGGIFD